jgi:hypothetical protein
MKKLQHFNFYTMKTKSFKYSVLLVLFIISYGCSSLLPEIGKIDIEETSIYDNNLRINVRQIYSWINKMPGAKPRFHTTGELELFEDSEYNINNITIKKIKIIQNNIAVYQFTPKLEIKMSNNSKTILFSTVKGLLLSSVIDSQKHIDVKIILSDSAEDINYVIPNVVIDEVH